MRVIRIGRVAAGIAAAMFLFTSPAWAGGDPYLPDGAANWCPGGKSSGGRVECWGERFPDGSVYSQNGGYGPAAFFGPFTWGNLTCLGPQAAPENGWRTPDTDAGACGGRGTFIP